MKTPVKITLGYTPTHYGPNAVDEANEFADQLNQSGLFEVELADAEWEEYQTLYKEGAYDLFILGWYPDILDADNYLTPFIRDGGFFEQRLLQRGGQHAARRRAGRDRHRPRARSRSVSSRTSWPRTCRSSPRGTGRTSRSRPTRSSGVEETLDPTYIFRFWGISKAE